MNKKPVFAIIGALVVLAVIIAVGIFTKLKLSQDLNTPAAVTAPLETAPTHAETSAATAAAAASANQPATNTAPVDTAPQAGGGTAAGQPEASNNSNSH